MKTILILATTLILLGVAAKAQQQPQVVVQTSFAEMAAKAAAEDKLPKVPDDVAWNRYAIVSGEFLLRQQLGEYLTAHQAAAWIPSYGVTTVYGENGAHAHTAKEYNHDGQAFTNFAGLHQ
jgi:hypothetical protein